MPKKETMLKNKIIKISLAVVIVCAAIVFSKNAFADSRVWRKIPLSDLVKPLGDSPSENENIISELYGINGLSLTIAGGKTSHLSSMRKYRIFSNITHTPVNHYDIIEPELLINSGDLIFCASDKNAPTYYVFDRHKALFSYNNYVPRQLPLGVTTFCYARSQTIQALIRNTGINPGYENRADEYKHPHGGWLAYDAINEKIVIYEDRGLITHSFPLMQILPYNLKNIKKIELAAITDTNNGNLVLVFKNLWMKTPQGPQPICYIYNIITKQGETKTLSAMLGTAKDGDYDDAQEPNLAKPILGLAYEYAVDNIMNKIWKSYYVLQYDEAEREICLYIGGDNTGTLTTSQSPTLSTLTGTFDGIDFTKNINYTATNFNNLILHRGYSRNNTLPYYIPSYKLELDATVGTYNVFGVGINNAPNGSKFYYKIRQVKELPRLDKRYSDEPWPLAGEQPFPEGAAVIGGPNQETRLVWNIPARILSNDVTREFYFQVIVSDTPFPPVSWLNYQTSQDSRGIEKDGRRIIEPTLILDPEHMNWIYVVIKVTRPIAILSDTHSHSSTADQINESVVRDIINRFISQQPSTVFHAGDLVSAGWATDAYNHNSPNGADNFNMAVIGRLANECSNAAFFPAMGDHEIWDGGSFHFNQTPQDFFRNFLFFTESNFPNFNSARQWGYSVIRNNIYFLILNTNIRYTPGSAQYNWLVNELTQAEAKRDNNEIKFIISIFHMPIYGKTNGKSMNEGQLPWQIIQLFRDIRIDAVFSGNNHNYQKLYDTEKGSYYIVIGSGGGRLRTPAGGTPSGYPYISILNFRAGYNFCRLSVFDNKLIIKVLGCDGNPSTSDEIPVDTIYIDKK